MTSVFAKRVPLVPLEGCSILLPSPNKNIWNQSRSCAIYKHSRYCKYFQMSHESKRCWKFRGLHFSGTKNTFLKRNITNIWHINLVKFEVSFFTCSSSNFSHASSCSFFSNKIFSITCNFIFLVIYPSLPAHYFSSRTLMHQSTKHIYVLQWVFNSNPTCHWWYDNLSEQTYLKSITIRIFEVKYLFLKNWDSLLRRGKMLCTHRWYEITLSWLTVTGCEFSPAHP